MKRPVTSFVFALVTVFLSPILIFIEFTALFGAGMIAYEDANPLWVKIIAVFVVILIGLVAVAVPALVLLMGIKARAAAKSTPTKGVGLATAAIVIAGIVTAGVAAFQLFVILSVLGECISDGC
jgi:hypothetical protein